MTVPHSVLCALMVWCVLLVPLAAQAESDCQTVAKQSVAVQGVRHEQAQANLDRMMSGITDTLFDVDCLDRISLYGGIRIYADLEGLVQRLKQRACDGINKKLQRFKSAAIGKISAPFDAAGLEYRFGVDVLPPQSRKLSGSTRDLNGDQITSLPDEPDSGVNEKFRQTLQQLFR